MKRIESIMNTRQPRRGALLLVVLSILVLFALVGLTFVVAAATYNKGSIANLRKDLALGDSASEADNVLMQLLRGPRDGSSSLLWKQDLLADMWGNQSVGISGDTATVTITRPQSGGGTSFDINQLWEIRVDQTAIPTDLFTVEQYYTGSIVTFTSGELRGQSHRILSYRLEFDESGMTPVFDGVTFIIDNDPIVTRTSLVDINGDGEIAPGNGDEFVVNDPPFNGTGRGFNPNQTGTAPNYNKRTLNLRDSAGDPVALSPNIRLAYPSGRVGGIAVDAGGSDEAYDAADYQNMYLSFTLGGSTGVTNNILPSFHRQDLLEYWVNYLNDTDTEFNGLASDAERHQIFRDPDNKSSFMYATAPTPALIARVKAIRRKTIFRPLTDDDHHPNFTGSNPNFDIFGTNATAQWDVDNDLDGTADSIWVDVGLPLKTDPQGRRYKPLAAILVKDMDGLLNVNANGFYSQLASFETTGGFPPTGTDSAARTLLQASNSGTPRHSQYSPSWDASNTPLDMQLVLGTGYGPADINLQPFFSAIESYNLMNARYAGLPGEPTVDDAISRMDNIGLVNSFTTSVRNRFGNPADRLGMGRMYMDYSGRPRFQPQVDGAALASQAIPSGIGQVQDDPYEFNLLQPSNFDAPFSYQELERVLRYEEYDSLLATGSEDRLMQLASMTLTAAPANRRLITTASFQVPAAKRVDVPYDRRAVGSGASQNMMFNGRAATERRPAPTLVSLLQERLREENGWDPTDPAEQILLKEKIHELLPPEVLRGEQFNLNRLLEGPANGIDDDSTFQTDDIFELQTSAQLMFQQGITTSGSVNPATSVGFTNWVKGTAGVGANAPNINGGTVNPNYAISYSASRQLMARYLYVMMLLMVEKDYMLPSVDNSLTDPQKEELMKRRIAQWAVNVVDYIDRDAVLTPFEFDLNPFTYDSMNGVVWKVNGDLADDEGTHRRVVWGAEAPELVISETLAFHDRRIKDTLLDDDKQKQRGPSAMSDDLTLDQYRIPQGSLFMEFYNPRNQSSNVGNAGLPNELYTSGGLHLNKMTPSGNYPVWRVVIANRKETSGAPTSLIEEMATRPDTVNFQPIPPSPGGMPGDLNTESILGSLKMLGQATDATNYTDEQYEIDRIVYFANYVGTTPDREFRWRGNNSTNLLLAPDGYFVVCPRQDTFIGSKPDTANDPAFNIDGTYSFHMTGANNGALQFLQNGALATTPTAYPIAATGQKTNLAISVTMDLPTAYGTDDPDGLPLGIGLNVSEPLRDDYYPKPAYPNPATMTGDLQYYTDGTQMTAPDIPFESDAGAADATYEDYPLNDADAALTAVKPLYRTQTAPEKQVTDVLAYADGYKTAILQRLANPWSDYDATLNPYISVDSMPIDLTVFNGEDNPASNTTVTANQFDPSEGADPNAATVRFGSRERGKRALTQDETAVATTMNGQTSDGNMLGVMGTISGTTIASPDEIAKTLQQTPPIWSTPRDTTTFPDDHFARPLVHTLGYINSTYGAPINQGMTVGSGTVNNAYVGSPRPAETRADNRAVPSGTTVDVINNPFSWLHWANSPMVSAYDLMMVPTSSPQRLLYEYSLVRKDNTNTVVNPYYAATAAGNGDSLDATKAPYGNLLNFFHSNGTIGMTGAAPANDAMTTQFARIFDFVTVPSRFSGTKKWFNYSQFNPTGGLRTDGVTSKVNDARLGYLFPFNNRSEFREPGKINLNTIPAQSVYESIFDPTFWNNGNFNFASWTAFQTNRQGHFSGTAGEYPSRFSNPYRTPGTSELMAELGSAGTPDTRLQLPPVEGSILRSVDPTSATKDPLFDLTLTNSSIDNTAVRHYRANDNPMLRYQAYQRLANVAGTQSNVFAVWITIGYFEVEPHDVDANHPDGWALAAEKGSDTGEIERHRAFYIIDRSVPVGYLPGEDMNVEDTIMLKRFIE
ncbi:hypothetical protein [Bremerella cremea]|uniref:hypothetical protein n=1 Tax=Bremerella cremea TaxID=1031537 RepID=UPI0031EBFE4E